LLVVEHTPEAQVHCPHAGLAADAIKIKAKPMIDTAE
jgi:hypothetical protein